MCSKPGVKLIQNWDPSLRSALVMKQIRYFLKEYSTFDIVIPKHWEQTNRQFCHLLLVPGLSGSHPLIAWAHENKQTVRWHIQMASRYLQRGKKMSTSKKKWGKKVTIQPLGTVNVCWVCGWSSSFEYSEKRKKNKEQNKNNNSLFLYTETQTALQLKQRLCWRGCTAFLWGKKGWLPCGVM